VIVNVRLLSRLFYPAERRRFRDWAELQDWAKRIAETGQEVSLADDHTDGHLSAIIVDKMPGPDQLRRLPI
jgi:hypothetical protein